jgi:adenosylhomocysteine nucleosidase
LIAIISATWDEIKGIKKEISKTQEGLWQEMEFASGNLYGKSVVLGQTGVGIKRARRGTSLIIQKFKPNLIISAGFGGALDADLKVGDIIVGEWVLSLKRNETMRLLSDLTGLGNGFKKGGILTENRFIHDPMEKRKLFETSGVLAVDMETWGVVEASLQSGIRVLSIRSISDESWEVLPNMDYIFSGGKLDKRKALSYFTSYPSHILPFFRFRFFNSKKSSRSLARFLRNVILYI